MNEFGKKIPGYTLVYKLEKHADGWDKHYSCHTSILIIDISHSICLYVGRRTIVKQLE